MGNSCRCVKQPYKDPFMSPEEPATPCRGCANTKGNSAFFVKTEAAFPSKMKRKVRAVRGVDQRYEKKKFQLWKPWHTGILAVRHETKEDTSPSWFLPSEAQNACLLGDTIERDVLAKKRPNVMLEGYATLTETTTCSVARRGETDTTTVSVYVTEEEKEDDSEESLGGRDQLKGLNAVDASPASPLESMSQKRPENADSPSFLPSDVPPHEVTSQMFEHVARGVSPEEKITSSQADVRHPQDTHPKRSVIASYSSPDLEPTPIFHGVDFARGSETCISPACKSVSLSTEASNMLFAKLSLNSEGTEFFPTMVSSDSVTREHNILQHAFPRTGHADERLFVTPDLHTINAKTIETERGTRKVITHALLHAKRHHLRAASKTRKESKSKKNKTRLKQQAVSTASITQKTVHLGASGEPYNSVARRKRRQHNNTWHKSEDVPKPYSVESKSLSTNEAGDPRESLAATTVYTDTKLPSNYPVTDFGQHSAPQTLRFQASLKTEKSPCFDFLPDDISGVTGTPSFASSSIMAQPIKGFPCGHQLPSAATASELQEFFCCSPGSSHNQSCKSPSAGHHHLPQHKTANYGSSSFFRPYTHSEKPRNDRIELPKLGIDLKKLCFLEHNASSQRPCTDRPQPRRIMLSPGWVATARMPRERDVRALSSGSFTARLPMFHEPMTDRSLEKCSNKVSSKTYSPLCTRSLVPHCSTSCSDSVPIKSGTQRTDNATPAASVVRYA